MPQTCSVCKHEQRRDIERDILAGKTLRGIALKYGMSDMAVARHQKGGHISARIERGFDLRRIAEATDLLEQIRGLLHESAFILEDAREATRTITCPKAGCGHSFEVKVADLKDRVAAAAQVGRTLELVGKVTGQIASPTVQAFMVQLGVPDESTLRSAVDMQRSMSLASLDDVEQECLEAIRFLLSERPEFSRTILTLLEGRSRAEVLPDESEAVPGSQVPSTGKDGGL